MATHPDNSVLQIRLEEFFRLSVEPVPQVTRVLQPGCAGTGYLLVRLESGETVQCTQIY